MDALQVYSWNSIFQGNSIVLFLIRGCEFSNSKLSGMQHKCCRADEKSGNRCEKGVKKKESEGIWWTAHGSEQTVFFGKGALKTLKWSFQTEGEEM